jgi:hypothetical protein
VACGIDCAKSIRSRLTFWRRREGHGATVSGSAHAMGSVFGSATAVPPLPSELSETARIAVLEQRVDRLRDDLAQYKSGAGEREVQVSHRLDGLSTRIQEETVRLEALSREIASSDARLQLEGLIAIGLGTALAAVPGIWQAVYVLSNSTE